MPYSPELKELIDANKQFAQRIAVRCHLESLNEEETKNYILHRLSVSGRTEPIFTEKVYKLIYKKSGGIPRRINQICDMCLLTGFHYEAKIIDEKIVNETVESLGV